MSFECLSNSSKCAIGEAQLSVEVEAAGAGQVSFVLRNEGSEELSAIQLFFDDADGVLGALLSVLDGTGVEFVDGGKPDNLKGGKKIDFLANRFASATKPAKENGVDPGEEVTLIFALAGTNTLEDVIAAIESAGLRLGINAKKAYVSARRPCPSPACCACSRSAAQRRGSRRRRS